MRARDVQITVVTSLSYRSRNARNQRGCAGPPGRERGAREGDVAEEQQDTLPRGGIRGRQGLVVLCPERHHRRPCRRANATAARSRSGARHSRTGFGTPADRDRCATASAQRTHGSGEEPAQQRLRPREMLERRRLGRLGTPGEDRRDDGLVLGVRVLDVARQQRERVEPRVSTRARWSAAISTSDGMPAISAIVRCRRVSRRR